ncbi:hypothetical protein XPA_003835 [Xanthoria parietina]
MCSYFLLFSHILSYYAVISFSLVRQTNGAATAPGFGGANLTLSDSEPTWNSVLTGGRSYCMSGNVEVTVTSTNFKIKYDQPRDQLAVTEFSVEMLQASSDLMQRLVDGPNPITGTWRIFSSLCLPADPVAAKNAKTVQILTHGDTLSSSYWDIAPGYSYIDAATAAGYATFSYDRIGVGRSEHPDPIQIAQAPLHLEILHALVTMLRNGDIQQRKFSNFVGVGHSAGSTVTQGVTTKYPKDFDAIILTGTSTVPTYVPLAMAAFNWQIAAEASPNFKGLPNGYFTQANSIGIQFAFFRYPNFDPKGKSFNVTVRWVFADAISVFEATVQDKQTTSIGELLTIGTIVAPSPAFTGPVDVVLGENDLVFCGGNCASPVDQSAAVQPLFYPNAAAGSRHYLAAGAGHSVNAHFSAKAAWAHQIDFLKLNGF